MDDVENSIGNWQQEAMAIMNDVRDHVAEIDTSHILPINESNIYLNVRTNEGATYCIHVCSRGFRIVSERFDCIDGDKIAYSGDEFYETIYSLLDQLSPHYVKSFGDKLCEQLLHLQNRLHMDLKESDEENTGNST